MNTNAFLGLGAVGSPAAADVARTPPTALAYGHGTQVFLTPTHLCIVMEFAPGGDMFEYVVRKNGLREDEARWFFQQ